MNHLKNTRTRDKGKNDCVHNNVKARERKNHRYCVWNVLGVGGTKMTSTEPGKILRCSVTGAFTYATGSEPVELSYNGAQKRIRNILTPLLM